MTLYSQTKPGSMGRRVFLAKASRKTRAFIAASTNTFMVSFFAFLFYLPEGKKGTTKV
jgi:TRAP-type C4-dicarboxylate transport system permease small subunit